MTKTIAVIGAGISGLACAYELKKAGFKVDVFEKEPHVGGRMASRKVKGKIFDIGADHFGYSYTHMLDYCKELGVKPIRMESYKFKVFTKGEVQTLYGSLSWPTRLKLMASITFANKNVDFFNLSKAAKYDYKNAFDFNTKKYGDKMAKVLSEGFINGYQFHQTKDLSSAVLISFFNTLKYDDWTLHHHKGGMQALPNALAKVVNAKTNTPVSKITAKENKVSVTTKTTKDYDAVILATTTNATHPTKPQKEFLKKIKYSKTISVCFEVPVEFLEGTGGVTFVPINESKIISGYVREAIKGEDTIKNGKTLLSCWLQEDFANKMMKKSDEKIFEAVKKGLISVCPSLKGDTSILVNADIKRWEQAMPKYYTGSIRLVKEFLDYHQGDQNVFFCGDYLNSPWTEGALRCGQRVAKHVIDAYKDLS